MADYIIDSGKIREMYDKLTDISSRVRFIADMKKYQIARDEKNKPVSEEEKKMIESIEAEFLDRYVTNGTFDTRRKVFETVGLMKAENSYNCYREYEGRLNGFSKNDPLREKKARWQLDQTSAGIENRILNDMTCNIKSCCDKNAGVRKQTYAALNINGNTTMQDLVRKCGVRKEDISAFLKEKGISGDTTVTAYYRQKYPDIRTEQLGDRIEEDVLNTITERWGANVTSDHLASKKLSSGQMKKLKKIASDNALPASFQDINDWVKDYGKRLFREDKDNVLNELESTFIERYTEGKKIFSEDMYRQNEEYRKIYNELSTPEEKLRFVLDLTVYTIGRNVTYGSELKFGGLANELLNDIVDRYITRGTSETSNRVFKCLGGLAAEHLLALRVEDEKLREEFSSEGKLGKKKAANLSKCTMSGDYVFQIRKFLNTCTQALVNSKSTAKAKILSENGIDKDTTLYEYAVKIAVRPEQISQYMKERNAEPDAKMKDVIKAANPGYNDAMALMTLKDEFVNDYSNHIQAEAAQAVLDSAGLDEKKLSHYYEMSENVSGEISTSGIDDWLDKEAPKRMDEIAATAGRFAINAFKRRYDKKTGFERYIRLHTGNDIVASDSEKRVDCLAKAVMASILKKCGSEFDIKRIRSLAETLKKDAAFIKKVKDTEAVTRALTDPDSIEEFKVALYSAPFKTMDGSDEKYIEHMNTLFEGMLPSKGRSDKYKALYDAVRRISELKGAYDESLPADRAARSALIRELNINLYYAAEEYIRDKEKVRTTTNGQKRFSDALDAVSIMASFAPGIKKYAQKTFDRINSKRSAAEGSEKYVSIRKYKVEVRKYEEANVPQERAAEKNAPEIKENPEDKVKPEEKVNQENKIKPEVKENPKEKAGTAANKLPDYLRKTDAALARLKEGKYENDPDHRIFLSDAIYAFVGQMVRATGG
ncbi:MAG: hypothetical protein IKQ56_01815, partial [Lachnospiraceae bacterium]|nr:hypothetical protein [Lachnospiraceae bacterium]